MNEQEAAMVHPDYELVDTCDACPHCGERRVDWLLIDEDHVDCMSCGKGYWLYGADGQEVA